jgi:large subunit ribosomal protein L25
MGKLIIKAEKRNITGRKVKKLRQQALVPANVFGKKVKSQSIQIKLADFEKTYKETGETGLLELHIGNEKKPALIHNVQADPVTDAVLHIDFLQVNLKEKVVAEIPIELTGESPAEKQGLGTVVQYMDEVEVEALPTDLPEKFEIDASILLEVDQTVYLKDLKYDKTKVEIKEDVEKIIAKLEPLREEKEEELVPEETPEEEKPEEEKPEEVEEKEERASDTEKPQS